MESPESVYLLARYVPTLNSNPELRVHFSSGAFLNEYTATLECVELNSLITDGNYYFVVPIICHES